MAQNTEQSLLDFKSFCSFQKSLYVSLNKVICLSLCCFSLFRTQPAPEFPIVHSVTVSDWFKIERNASIIAEVFRWLFVDISVEGLSIFSHASGLQVPMISVLRLSMWTLGHGPAPACVLATLLTQRHCRSED